MKLLCLIRHRANPFARWVAESGRESLICDRCDKHIPIMRWPFFRRERWQHGSMVPWWAGAAWFDYSSDQQVFIQIPMNRVLRILRASYFWLKRQGVPHADDQ